jgi:hypothetical protein
MNAKETNNEEAPSRMEYVTIAKKLLVTAITQLHGTETLPTDNDASCSSIAELIVASMSTPSRVYHSMQHVLDIVQDIKLAADGGNHPIPILAALFHDVIYLNVDVALSTAQAEILADILVQDNDGKSQSLALQITVSDPLIDMVRLLFGFDLRPGQGYNEYISALLAVRVLSPLLDLKHLLQLTACIEASIPFRSVTDSSTPMERLYGRLEHTNRECGAGLSDVELVETVQMAAFFTNCDLGSFCQTDSAVFLENSWKLLPEWKPALLSDKCRLQDLHDAFQLSHERYHQTNVQLIFQHFRGFPASCDLEGMRQRARDNLHVIGQYMSVRLLQLRVLLDLLKVATIDPARPFTFLQQVDARIDQHSTDRPSQLTDNSIWNDQVYVFLTQGRGLAFDWDAAASPLSALLYTQLGGQPAVTLGSRLADCKEEVTVLLPVSLVNQIGDILSQVLPEFAAKFESGNTYIPAKTIRYGISAA